MGSEENTLQEESSIVQSPYRSQYEPASVSNNRMVPRRVSFDGVYIMGEGGLTVGHNLFTRLF